MIFSTIGKLLLAMGVGCYLSKKEIFTPQVCQKLSYFVINITVPMLIVTSLNGTDLTDKGELLRYIFTGICFYLVIPLLGKGLNYLTNVPTEERNVYEACYIFSNNMFMGYPVAAAIYGDACIFQLSMFHLGVNILYYTYGIRLFQKNKGEKQPIKVRKLFNPGTIAALIAIVLCFSGIKLPEEVTGIFQFLGNLSSPLSMVVIGATIGTYSLKNILKDDKRLYFVALIRLVLIPFAAYYILTFLGFTGALRGVATITIGMPVATMVSMSCIEFENQEKLGSAAVVLTTVVSLVTIPVMMLILG